VSSEREQLRLLDIVENIDRIDNYLGGVSFASFAADPMRADAVERCLQRVTEAVIRVGTERMAVIAPEIPVREVRGLGNVLRHDYGRIDLATIYATVTDRLPELRMVCARALARTSGDVPE
jgi:uncharacterized protein with HEPN domain